jgi:hypothetical protein
LAAVGLAAGTASAVSLGLEAAAASPGVGSSPVWPEQLGTRTLLGVAMYAIAARGAFRRVCPSHLHHVGAFGYESLPAGRSYKTLQQAAMIDAIGHRRGCHTCGNKRLRTFHGDHQPPRSLNQARMRFYPQCTSCSNQQGGTLALAQARGTPLAPKQTHQLHHRSTWLAARYWLPMPAALALCWSMEEEANAQATQQGARAPEPRGFPPMPWKEPGKVAEAVLDVLASLAIRCILTLDRLIDALLAEVGRRQDWQRGDEVVFQEQPLPASWAWVEGVSPGRFTAALEQELARLQAQQRLLRSQAGLSPPERRALELLEQDLAMLEAELTLRR